MTGRENVGKAMDSPTFHNTEIVQRISGEFEGRKALKRLGMRNKANRAKALKISKLLPVPLLYHRFYSTKANIYLEIDARFLNINIRPMPTYG